MNCNKFADNLMDYIENELGTIDSNEMQRHMESCNKCREMYERRLSTIHSFQQVLAFPGINFTSKKQGILSNIDKDRYKNTLKYKLKYGLISHKKLIVTLAAASFLFMLVPKTLSMLGIDKMNISNGYSKYSNNSQDANKDSQSKLPSTEASKEASNTLSQSVETELEELRNVIPANQRPWYMHYADATNLVFSNYTHLLVYNQTLNQITSAVDLRDLGYIPNSSENVDYDVRVSPNGKYAVLGDSGPLKNKKEFPNKKPPVYFLNFEKNSFIRLEDEFLFEAAVKWSMNSNWMMKYNSTEASVTAYNLKNWKSYSAKLSENEGIEDIFIGDNGNLVIKGKRNYALESPEYKDRIELQGTPIGFNGSNPLTVQNDKVFEYSGKDKTIFTSMQNYNEKAYFNQSGDVIAIFNDKNSAILDLKEKNISEPAVYKVRSPLNWGISLEPVYQNGKKAISVSNINEKEVKNINISDTGLNSIPELIDKDNFIMVDIVNGAKNSGEFQILKYNLQNGYKQVLFKNTK